MVPGRWHLEYEMVLLQMRERCGSSSSAEVAVEQGGQAPELEES